MDVAAKICAVAFIFLIPSSHTVGPRALNMQWSDLAAAGLFIALIATRGWRVHEVLFPIPWWITVYLAARLPSLVFSHDPVSWVELVKTGYLVCLAMAIGKWATDKAVWLLLARTAAIIAALVTVLTLMGWVYATLTGQVPWQMGVVMDVPNVGLVVRMKGMLLTPTFLANYLTMALPLLVGFVAGQAAWPRVITWGSLPPAWLRSARPPRTA